MMRRQPRVLCLEKFFLFLGYVPEAEKVLAGCDIVLRPSRGNDPWGRDVMEGWHTESR
jgi:hypothetical protein